MEWRGREWSGGEGRGGQGRAGQGARLLRWTFTGRDFIPLDTPVERAAAYCVLRHNADYVTHSIILRVTNVIFIVTYYTLPPIESSPSFWMTRSQRSRRRDKHLWRQACDLSKRSIRASLDDVVVLDAIC